MTTSHAIGRMQLKMDKKDGQVRPFVLVLDPRGTHYDPSYHVHKVDGIFNGQDQSGNPLFYTYSITTYVDTVLPQNEVELLIRSYVDQISGKDRSTFAW